MLAFEGGKIQGTTEAQIIVSDVGEFLKGRKSQLKWFRVFAWLDPEFAGPQYYDP